MQHKTTAIWAVVIITFIAATLAVLLRIISRLLIKVKFWWDDWLAFAAYATAIAWTVVLCLWLKEGLGYHIYDIDNGKSIEGILYVNKLYLYIAELVYGFAVYFGKISILALYYRMFGVTNIKLPIRILIVCSTVWFIIRTIMGIWHCVPIQAFWDDKAGGYCAIDDSKFFFGTLLVHLVIDIIILSLPIVQVMKLRLPRAQKIAVTIMFMFGIFICVGAIGIMVESVTLDAKSIDVPYNISMIALWATIEVNLVTVSACLPILKPALITIFRCAPFLGSHNSSSNVSKSYLRSKTLGDRPLPGSDDGGSTYQLADSVHADSRTGGAFEHHALDRSVVQGPKTHITAVALGDGKQEEGDKGIRIKNETVVQYSVRSRDP